MIKDFTLLVLFLSVSASIWFLFPYKLLIVLIKSNPGIENNQKYFFRLLCKFMNIKLWFFVSIVMKIHNYKIMIFCETLVFTQGFSFCEKCNFLPNFVIDARNFRNFSICANNFAQFLFLSKLCNFLSLSKYTQNLVRVMRKIAQKLFCFMRKWCSKYFLILRVWKMNKDLNKKWPIIFKNIQNFFSITLL